MSKSSSRASASFMPAILTPQLPALRTTANPSPTSNAQYFITLCTHERQCLFGEIVDGQMLLNKLGAIVEDEWQSAAQDRQDLDCQQWIIMPNHIHGIVTVAESADQHSTSDTKKQQTLSDWIDQFKATVTERINSHRKKERPIWQPTDDQQLIPHHFAFNIFRQYIRSNPHAWLWDKLHPDSPSDWLYPEGSI